MLCKGLNGKEIQKRVVDVYVQLIHFAVEQKLYNTVKQLYSNLKKKKKDDEFHLIQAWALQLLHLYPACNLGN